MNCGAECETRSRMLACGGPVSQSALNSSNSSSSNISSSSSSSSGSK
ncbi:hypothetical protein T4B_11487 [Trichinella pseudospiralis]|uniref:Uncharacterized protein n=1 Tax=Trichinella pseudospiralis TaxID=6337 RepID=A0A0V1J1P4_TRIPS|nr:hypothetical protein T4A_171 [Trichinella pseudospiralis]KRZ28892.1 hypothetical protein T4B_11487 [Trichinella pseudospiralis]